MHSDADFAGRRLLGCVAAHFWWCIIGAIMTVSFQYAYMPAVVVQLPVSRIVVPDVAAPSGCRCPVRPGGSGSLSWQFQPGVRVEGRGSHHRPRPWFARRLCRCTTRPGGARGFSRYLVLVAPCTGAMCTPWRAAQSGAAAAATAAARAPAAVAVSAVGPGAHHGHVAVGRFAARSQPSLQ